MSLGFAAFVIGGLIVSPYGGYADDGSKQNKATFAGGCFWCMEEAFERSMGLPRRSQAILEARLRIRRTNKFLLVALAMRNP